MKKVYENKVNEWVSLADSIAKIYLKIIELEKNNDLGEEYKNLLYILPTALRFEKERFLSMGLNEENYQVLSKRFDISDEDIIDATEGNSEKFTVLRKHNYFMSMLNMHYNGFYREKSTFNIFEAIANQNELANIQNEIYSENYHTNITVNFVQMLERYIKEVQDEDLKSYLIYVKYLMIATVPKYEENYVLFSEKLLPIRDIIKTFPLTDGYSDTKIATLTKQNLIRDIETELETMLQINNFIIPYYTNVVYKELALNKARLISLNSKEFIEDMRKKVDSMMHKSNQFYSIINRLIKEMFDDALTLISTPQIKRVPK